MKETQVILDRLLEKYENSKHLTAPNTSRRRVMLQINKKDLLEYDYENAAVRDGYNAAAVALEQQSLVRLEWDREDIVLSTIVLNLEQVMLCYTAAGRLHPREKTEHFIAQVSQKLGNTPVPYELSGPCVIDTPHGQLDVHVVEPFGIAIPSTLVDAIIDVDLTKVRCITFIENKTNYDEYLLTEKQPEELVIYHGGFSSPKKSKFFSRLTESRDSIPYSRMPLAKSFSTVSPLSRRFF